MGLPVTGQELHALFLQQGMPRYVPWSAWEDTPERTRQSFDAVAAILDERQAERVYAETAGEDI